MNLAEKLEADLASLGYLVRQQGDFTEHEPLPETFLTYVLINTSEVTHYSNKNRLTQYLVQIAFYSLNKSLVDNADAFLKVLLKSKGYFFLDGRDMPKNRETQHYGYAADYRIYTEDNTWKTNTVSLRA